MAATPEQIRATVELYVDRVAHGSADEVLALYAEGATVEDPVGTEPRTTREAIHEFYAALEGLEQEATLHEVRIAGGEAAFRFELATRSDGATFTLAPIDVMTFDDDGRITSMRAFWGDGDMAVS